MTYRHARIMALSGFAAGVGLGGALSLPFWTALLVRAALSPVQAQAVNRLLAEPLLTFWPVGTLLAGFVWGLGLARLIDLRPTWRFALAGGLSVGVGHILVTSAPFLTFANGIRPSAPLHVRFAVEFVLGLGLAAGLVGLALGFALPSWRAALTLALGSSVAAAVPAVLVVVGFDLLGVRVGSGNAAMAKVVSLAFPASAITAGAIIGRLLVQCRPED